MSDIFKEVDEDLRRDRMLALWKRFGPYIIGAAVGLVLVVAGRAYWTGYIDQKRQAESRAYDEALAAFLADGEGGRAALGEIIEGGNQGYAALARFRLAADREAKGRIEEALAHYESLAADGGINPRLRGLAALMTATLYIDQGRDIEAREALIGVAADHPAWKFAATELLGFLDFKAGNVEQARSIYQSLATDPEVPQSMKDRAREMLSLLPPAGGLGAPEEETGTTQEEES